MTTPGAAATPTASADPARAWTRATLRPADWLVPVPDACVAELDAVAAHVSAQPAPVETLRPESFRLEACAALMDRVRDVLERGPGLAVVDRIPVERYGVDENRAIGWLLAAMLGPIVAQKWDGTRIYDVRDLGRPLGYGVRRSITNLDQPFHTDGPWLWMPAAFVGLFCLQPALEGGLSRFAGLVTAHEALQRRHPDLLDRLYRPFRWDRQAEHGPDEPRFATHPVFQRDARGRLIARHYEDYVHSGYALAGEALDEAGREALAALRAIVDDPAHWVEFRIERGQLQYLDNRQFAHSRTAFRDPPDRAVHRHMIRFWNRPEGGPGLEGDGERQRPSERSQP
ncbi:MAG TPA: TauD/TfdA family dioxygenase [Candidatus Tectomicrobia bacterium]|nr:TauD/TfdA family dioxygenase [Candidatus Tectomicrobia bacterium]